MNKARKYLGKNLENVKLWNDGVFNKTARHKANIITKTLKGGI